MRVSMSLTTPGICLFMPSCSTRGFLLRECFLRDTAAILTVRARMRLAICAWLWHALADAIVLPVAVWRNSIRVLDARRCIEPSRTTLLSAALRRRGWLQCLRGVWSPSRRLRHLALRFPDPPGQGLFISMYTWCFVIVLAALLFYLFTVDPPGQGFGNRLGSNSKPLPQFPHHPPSGTLEPQTPCSWEPTLSHQTTGTIHPGWKLRRRTSQESRTRIQT